MGHGKQTPFWNECMQGVCDLLLVLCDTCTAHCVRLGCGLSFLFAGTYAVVEERTRMPCMMYMYVYAYAVIFLPLVLKQWEYICRRARRVGPAIPPNTIID